MRKVRDVLRLRHTLGMSFRQISEATGIGKTVVGEYVRRAAKRLSSARRYSARTSEIVSLSPLVSCPGWISRLTRMAPSWVGAPTSPSFGNRILVSNLLHEPARKRNSINRLRETAVIDQLLAPIAEQLRRVRNRILY